MTGDWKFFTPEEVKILGENLWVKKVTPKLIRYTDEFKEEFLRQHKQGKTSRQIIESLGFDPKILGRSRIEGIQITCKDYALRNQERLGENGAETPVSGSSISAQMKRMQHKLSYMEQQIEFIKKTIVADRGARRS